MLWHELYDQQAKATPEACACTCFRPPQARVELSYKSVCQRSLRLASGLLLELKSCRSAASNKSAIITAPIVALHLAQTHPDFLPLLLAVSRVGVSFALMSTDLHEKDLEEARNALILAELQPVLVIGCDGDNLHEVAAAAVDDSAPRSITVDTLATLSATSSVIEEAKECGPKPLPPPPLGYLFTGGTTRTRCATVTHAMFAHEHDHYRECLHLAGPAPRVLAQTSVYWGASALGQVSIALAYGGCAVFCVVRGPEELRAAVAAERIDVLGITPSELETLAERPAVELPGVRGVFTWGETLQPQLAARWQHHPQAQLRELLISTECWLSLHRSPLEATSGGGFRTVRGTRTLILTEDGQPAPDGEVGELVLDGPMVTSGYVPLASTGGAPTAPESSPFCSVGGRQYFRTRDLVRVGRGGLLEFRGRADLSTKVQGKWVDLLAIEELLQVLPGIAAVRVIPGPAHTAQPHAFLVFARGADVAGVVGSARKLLPPDSYVHVVDHLPRHPVTRKVDLQRLRELAELPPDGSWPMNPDLPPSPDYLVTRATTMVWRHGQWTLVALAVALAWDARALFGLLSSRSGSAGRAAARSSITAAGFALLPFMHLAFLHCTGLSRMYWLERAASFLPFNVWGVIAWLLASRGVARPGSLTRKACNFLVAAWAGVGLGWAVQRRRALSFIIVFWVGIGHRLHQDVQHRLHPRRWLDGPQRGFAELKEWLAGGGGPVARWPEGGAAGEGRPAWASAVCFKCGCGVRISLRVDRAAADGTASNPEGDGAKDGDGNVYCWRCWARVMTQTLDDAASVALQLLSGKAGSDGKDTLPLSTPTKSKGGLDVEMLEGSNRAPSEVPSPPLAVASPTAEQEPREWRTLRTDFQDVVDLPPLSGASPVPAALPEPEEGDAPELRRLLAAVAHEAVGSVGPLGASASLHWLDSLRVARLAARLRLELGAPRLSTAAVRRASNVTELLEAVQSAQEMEAPQQLTHRTEDSSLAGEAGSMAPIKASDGSTEYAVHYSPGQALPMGAWVVRSIKPLDPVRLREATQLLVERHGALRARPLDPMKLLSFCLDTGILFTLVARKLDRFGPFARLFRRAVSRALCGAWPRVRVPPPGREKHAELEVLTVGDQRALELALRGRREVLLKSGASVDVCLGRLRAQVAGLWVFGQGGNGDVVILPPPPSHRDAPLIYVDRGRREAGMLVAPGQPGWVPPPYGFSAVLCARLQPNSAMVWLRLLRGEMVVLWKADDSPQTNWQRHVARLVPSSRYPTTTFDYLCVQAFHSLADGQSYDPIVGDLLELYDTLAPSGGTQRPPMPPLAGEALAVLQQRLFAALDATPLAVCPQLVSLRGSLTTIKFRGRGYNHSIGIQRGAVEALRRSAFRYGVPVDVLLLALTAVAIARAGKKESVDLTLYVPMRDGPGETGLVGLFADWRVLTVRTALGTSTVLGVALEVAQALRLRRWSCFNALSKAEATMVNFQHLDTTPPASRAGCVQVGEELWRLGEQQKGLRLSKSDQLEWVLQPLSVTIEQQDEETWWVILTCAVSWYPHSWAKRFVQGFEDALHAILFVPTQRVHREAPEDLSHHHRASKS